jgi:hypothetical protein
VASVGAGGAIDGLGTGGAISWIASLQRVRPTATPAPPGDHRDGGG